MTTQEELVRIARAVVENGRPIKVGWYDEGTPESGPRGGAFYGYRWGELVVDMPDYVRDHAFITSRRCEEGPQGPNTGYPVIWGQVTDPDVLAAIDQVRERDREERGYYDR